MKKAMLAEVRPFQSLSTFFERTIARLQRTEIKQLDAYSLFVHYRANLAAGMSPEDARKDFRRLLEANLRTYTQEGIGDAAINEYGTEVLRGANAYPFRFRNALADDSILYTHLKNTEVYQGNPVLLRHFELELSAWAKLYMEVVAPFEDLIGRTDNPQLTKDLEQRGFRHLVPGNVAQGLCDVSPLLVSLFPELEGIKQIEMYEAPDKYVMASPRFWGHHNGETTIARLTRFVYIPSLGKFAFLERGLFTAYTNDQILEFFTLDGHEKPDLHSTEEILAHVAVLADVYREMAPVTVFQSIIDKIGKSPEIEVDKNIIRDGERDFSTQVAYMDALLTFEEELCKTHPELLVTQSQRLERPMLLVMHSLLRNKPLDVEHVTDDYRKIYEQMEFALNPSTARRIFNTLTLASHPDFSVRILSVIDCGTGTLLGASLHSLPEGLQGIDMHFGAGAAEMLAHFESQGIATKAELHAFCSTFDLDESTFTHWGVCKNKDCQCHSNQFLGPCDWCPICEAKDNLKKMGWNPNAEDENDSEQDSRRDQVDALPHKPVGLDLFVASIMNTDLIWERSFADYTSPAVH